MASTNRASDRPKTLDQFATDKLREAILDGDFAAGARLEESELSRRLDVSRTPVRVALRSLAAEGLVTVHPHRGTAVTDLAPEEVEELYLIRASLEALASRLAVPHLKDEQIADLRAILDESDRAPDLKHWMHANRSFHMKIYEAANLPRLYALIGGLFNTAIPYCLQLMANPEYFQLAKESHLRLLGYCDKRDGVGAAEEIQEHLRIGCARVLALPPRD